MKIAGILLAAGQSERFGKEDKLLAHYENAPLVTHAANTLVKFAPDVLIAITSNDNVADLLPKFENVTLESNGLVLSDSLQAGIRIARLHDATHALVVLGDMPMIDVSLLRTIADRCLRHDGAAASDGFVRMPPVCIPQAQFEGLMKIKGDLGARSFLGGLPEDAIVQMDETAMTDVDTVADLSRLNNRLPPKTRRCAF